MMILFLLASLLYQSLALAERPLIARGSADRRSCGTVADPALLSFVASLALNDGAQFPSVVKSGLFLDDDVTVKRRASERPSFTPNTTIVVPTYFHILATSMNISEGWIEDSQIKAQLDVLNDNYAPAKIQYDLKGITKTVNDTWARDGDVFTMKKTLRRGDMKTLNVYFVRETRDDYLGYIEPVRAAKRGSRKFTLDGVTVMQDTMPGGTRRRFNQGKTLTHEVGHWHTLFHPFGNPTGLSCTGVGDYVADTPPQLNETFGCPIGKDTCEGDGVDSIHNYMDYSDDSCMFEFTPLQIKRMHDSWAIIRNT